MVIETKVIGRENQKLDIAIDSVFKAIVLNYIMVVIINSIFKVFLVNLIFGSMLGEFACR